jgi:hypothetical protein
VGYQFTWQEEWYYSTASYQSGGKNRQRRSTSSVEKTAKMVELTHRQLAFASILT